MELHEINKIIKSLPEKHKDAILKLIDIKTNEDMKEVIQTIKHLENRVDSQITLFLCIFIFTAVL